MVSLTAISLTASSSRSSLLSTPSQNFYDSLPSPIRSTISSNSSSTSSLSLTGQDEGMYVSVIIQHLPQQHIGRKRYDHCESVAPRKVQGEAEEHRVRYCNTPRLTLAY